MSIVLVVWEARQYWNEAVKRASSYIKGYEWVKCYCIIFMVFLVEVEISVFNNILTHSYYIVILSFSYICIVIVFMDEHFMGFEF